MGFRDPLTTAAGVDTGGPTGPGARLYADTSDPIGFPRHVLEFRDGLGSDHATISRTSYGTEESGSVGGMLALYGGSYGGESAGSFVLGVEESPDFGLRSYARISSPDGRLHLPGDAPSIEVDYVPGVATGYHDALAGWTGLRSWERGGTVTVSGAVKLLAAIPRFGVIAYVAHPPLSTVQINVHGSTSVYAQVRADGSVRLDPGQAGGYITSFLLTYASPPT